MSAAEIATRSVSGTPGADRTAEPGPHQGQPVLVAGPAPEKAAGAVLLVHGRGAGAADILGLGEELAQPELTLVAPQAAGLTWYPQRFIAPIEANEPYLSSALARLEELVDGLAEKGVPAERVLLAGFSQGACLTAEYLVRRPRRYAGAAIFTGGLIGPPGTSWGPGEAAGDGDGPLAGTPVFLGSGDPDPHVPWQRVEESAEVLGRLGGEVTLRRYPGMGHTINREELSALRRMAAELAVAGRAG